MALLSFKPAIPGDSRRREDRSREKIFLEHYSWLLECALNITHGQRERAEDLVHDVFLEFLDYDGNLASILDIRGYLNGILRNLHLLQLRRATRHPMQSLSLFDYDSALIGLRAWTSVEQFQSADLLVRACDFACYRKETALSASIMILRFFHGYYPGEICLLLKARRNMVDKWIERSRNEIKEYLEAPYPLPNASGPECNWPSPTTSNAFLARLRRRVFASCTTACSILSENSGDLGAQEIAHLVSCQPCLDRRSKKAGLAHVAARMADDISDRDDGSTRGGSGGTGEAFLSRRHRKPSRHSLLRQAYERRKERFEHRPKELSLTFDGQVRATLLINGPTNRLNLALDAKEVPGSIAVLSEQDLRFLILSRDQLVSSERRVYGLALSDDRSLQVTVTPETLGPSIQIVYEDPLFLPETAKDEGHAIQKIDAGNRIFAFPISSEDPAPNFRPGWADTLFNKLRNLIPAMNPLLTSAGLLSLAAIVCFVFWLRTNPHLAAGDLLDRAQKSERAASATGRTGVICEKVRIRTPRRTVERTIYRDVQGVRRPRRHQLSPEDEQLKNKLTSAGVDWDAPLSAIDFAEWRHRFGGTEDAVTRSGPHLLTLTATPDTRSDVIRESLTVRDTDFHAIERTVNLRDGGTVEIAELNYNMLPWGAANRDWFEPLSGQTATDMPGILPALSIHAHHVLSNLELDEAELRTRVALNQLHADTGEQIHIARGSRGIEVKGVVESELRKQQIVSELSQLPQVRANILSVEELRSDQQSGTPLDQSQPIQVYSVEAQESPLEQYLREKKMPTDQLASVSHSLLYGSLGVQQAEVHLSELRPHFEKTNHLPADLQNQIAALAHSYINAVEAGLDSNGHILESLGLSNASEAGLSPESRFPDEDLVQQIRHYQELNQELITSGSGPSRPAGTIAGELITASMRIRKRLAQIAAAVPNSHD